MLLTRNNFFVSGNKPDTCRIYNMRHRILIAFDTELEPGGLALEVTEI